MMPPLCSNAGEPLDLLVADEAIDFDQETFITKGLGPNGKNIEYYNFDVQTETPVPIYVLFSEGENSPVEDQLNILDVIPGDNGYNDFWQVYRVDVPEDYEASVVTSKADIDEEGYTITPTQTLVNCPVVPEGSTADGTRTRSCTISHFRKRHSHRKNCFFSSLFRYLSKFLINGGMNEVFKALNDRTRRAILVLLRKDRMTAGEIADNFEMSRPSISHHLDVLRRAGLVHSEKKGQYIFYAINTTVLEDIIQWIISLKSD